MSWQRLAAQGTVVLTLVLAAHGPADEPSKADPKKDDKQVMKSVPRKRTPATSVNFKKELGMPFPSLGTLGTRIETARRSDPVALANAAQELHTAEEVSGKKAAVTSQAVLTAAAELAQMRRQVPELKAVLHVSQQIASEAGLIARIKQSIADAQQLTQLESQQVLRNEAPSSSRNLLVNNYSTEYFDVYVNGFMKMQVPPGSSKWCVIEHKWNPTVLTAYGDEDSTEWGPQYVWGNFKTYTWNLYGSGGNLGP